MNIVVDSQIFTSLPSSTRTAIPSLLPSGLPIKPSLSRIRSSNPTCLIRSNRRTLTRSICVSIQVERMDHPPEQVLVNPARCAARVHRLGRCRCREGRTDRREYTQALQRRVSRLSLPAELMADRNYYYQLPSARRTETLPPSEYSGRRIGRELNTERCQNTRRTQWAGRCKPNSNYLSLSEACSLICLLSTCPADAKV